MFQNSGKKITRFVKIVFYANAILVALCVLGLALALGSQGGVGAATGVLLGGVIIGGILLFTLYLSMLCIFAFGELVQSNAEQVELLRHLSSKGSYSGMASGSAPGSGHASASRSASATKTICPHCGARQSEGSTSCKYCGTPLN